MNIPTSLRVSFPDWKGHNSFPLQPSYSMSDCWVLLQSAHIILFSFLFYFTSPAEEFLNSRLCFLIFFRAMPFSNLCCALPEVEPGFTELCGFLSTPSPVFEYLYLVSHFGCLVNRLRH